MTTVDGPGARIPRLVSVIVPSYDPGAELAEQLAAVSAQDYPGAIEILVAHNGPGPVPERPADPLDRDRPRDPARFIDARAQRGPGAARNAGARAARGDFLAFCDADDLVSSSWLRDLVGTAGHADIVGGSLEGTRLNDPGTGACYELPDPAAAHLGFLPAAAGANLGIWANVFAALGGFAEDSRTGEDISLVWTAQLRGYVYAPSPALVHKRLPTDNRDAARRFFHYGLGDAWLYRRFRTHGMPRRDPAEARQLTLALLRLFAGMDPEVRRCRWNLTLWLTYGRLTGSLRHRVFFM